MGIITQDLKGAVILVRAFGCRSSLCEGEFLAGELKSRGAKVTGSFKDHIDAAVILTCSVTSEADRKCRQSIRRARRSLGHDGILAVCGCWAQSVDAGSARELGIDILTGSRGKIFLPNELEAMILSRKRSFKDLRDFPLNQPNVKVEWEELEIKYPVMHSRAFIKIQDGCNHFCSYCIIPFLRGRPVSRPSENIISEIDRLVQNGCNEVILTGIHLGIYGHDINSSLSELVKKISGIEKLKRLRLGSLEPFSLDENLLNALSECPSFCSHLHLPLQSGDDKILSLMHRGYTSGDFLKICESARLKLGDDLHISSDILVGFPGENDNAFRNTLEVMQKARLGRVHVFPFSERKGTLAERLDNKVDKSAKDSRAAEAILLGQELFSQYAKSFVGKRVDVLIEKTEGNYAGGHSKHYLEVSFKGTFKRNRIVSAKAVSESNGKLEATALNRD